MKLWQANLGRNATAAEFTENLDRLLETAGRRAVICLQEIDEADAPEEHAILARRVRKTHTIVGTRTAVPILVPKHLDIIGDRQSLACRGLAKFTPNRPLNEAELYVGPNLVVTVFNFHVPLDRPETRTRRTAVRRHVRNEARGHANGAWVADTNTRRGWPVIVPGEKSVTDAGIDKAKAWSQTGRRVVVTDRQTVDLTIDGHDAHGADVRWERS